MRTRVGWLLLLLLQLEVVADPDPLGLSGLVVGRVLPLGVLVQVAFGRKRLGTDETAETATVSSILTSHLKKTETVE